MALPPKPPFDFHGGIKKFLEKVKPGIKPQDRVVLIYGWKDIPFAKIVANMFEYDLPVPVSPGVYGDWAAWFKHYVEVQVGLVAEEVKIKVYVQGNKNTLLDLYDGKD